MRWTFLLVLLAALQAPDAPARRLNLKGVSVVRADEVRQAIRDLPQPDARLGSQQLRVSWGSGDARTLQRRDRRAGIAAAPLSLLSRRHSPHPVQHPRRLDLAEEKLLVLSLDVRGQIVSWSVIPDPRIVRAEAPGPDGTLRGQTFERTSVEFLLDIPDDARIRQASIYRPEWRDGEWDLRLVSAIDLPQTDSPQKKD